jgi:crotonobetainyl-CoA:carnitine CoA-transferase CaiB-like acyl-CoA transferase
MVMSETHALPLDGLTVVDLSWGTAGAVTTMLLADSGATVVKVEPPSGDPFRATAGYTVWNRGKRSVVLDLHAAADRDAFLELVHGADVVVESFAPGTTTRLGIDEPTLRGVNPQLVYCSITGYGRTGAHRDRPGYDALVQARTGLQNEQPGLRPGPVFLHTPLPSFGAALLASVGIRAALLARARLGRGQWVETSLAQGALLWTTQVWKRAERPTPILHELWRIKEFPPTPCFEAGDGEWFHPMPHGVPVALAHLGRDPGEIDMMGAAFGDYEDRKAYFEAVGEIYRQRPRDEWVALLQAAEVPCQPVGTAEAAFDHPQLVHNGAVTVVDVPGVGPVRQFGRAFRTEGEPAGFSPEPAPAVGEHTAALVSDRASVPVTATGPAVPDSAPVDPTDRGPLAGIRVLDFGTALAGPFGTMILGDLGADVIKVDPVGRGVGQPGESTWVACQRGKRSIAIDLKADAGRRIATELIASADVLHYNLRTGVAERLGYGYEQARAINPRIVFCHVTGYGSTGPLATWPGVDQMGQALCGHEYEQGATPSGGHPTWYRFGMCDAATGMLSIVGVLEALLAREAGSPTPGSRKIEADILTAALFLSSSAFVGPDALPTRPHLDAEQMGLGALHRLYATTDGWLCVVADADQHWKALCAVTGLDGLVTDPRFSDTAERARNGEALAAILEPVLGARTAAEWFAALDGAGVPCEVAELDGATRLWDDADAGTNTWVAGFRHPVWGRLDQPAGFVDFSVTPARPAGPPPVLGADTSAVLAELGYDADAIEALRVAGAVAW